MANNIELVTKYQPLVDEVFQEGSLTKDLESKNVIFSGAKEIKILKSSAPKLGSYDRNSGYKKSDVEAHWQNWELSEDRGVEFSVDAMDNEETQDLTFGTAVGETERLSAIPEVDTFRFAKMASTPDISKVETPVKLTTGEQVKKAIIDAMSKMDEDQVPDGRILYITPTLKRLIDDLDLSKSKAVMENFAKIVKVPNSRFFTASQYNETTEAIEKTVDACDINFMIVHPSAVQAVAKHAKLRIFEPDINQEKDAYKCQMRLYHGLNVYENKVAGIYLHYAPKA